AVRATAASSRRCRCTSSPTQPRKARPSRSAQPQPDSWAGLAGGRDGDGWGCDGMGRLVGDACHPSKVPTGRRITGCALFLTHAVFSRRSRGPEATVLAFRPRPLTLRTELSLVLSSLLALSIGLAGGTAIYQSRSSMRRELI